MQTQSLYPNDNHQQQKEVFFWFSSKHHRFVPRPNHKHLPFSCAMLHQKNTNNFVVSSFSIPQPPSPPELSPIHLHVGTVPSAPPTIGSLALQNPNLQNEPFNKSEPDHRRDSRHSRVLPGRGEATSNDWHPPWVSCRRPGRQC